MAEVDGCLMSAMQYNSDLFDAETITRWLEHWETLLAGIVAGPDVAISDLPLLPAEEQQRLLEWSSAKRLSPLSPRENGVAGEGALLPSPPGGEGSGVSGLLLPRSTASISSSSCKPSSSPMPRPWSTRTARCPTES